MPPGDTIILNSLDQLPDSVRHIVDSLRQAAGIFDEEKRPQFLFPQWGMFLFILLIAWATAYFYVIRPASAKRRKAKEIQSDNSADGVITEIKYDQWLGKHNPYYASLTVELKKRFIKRVMAFKESKEFRYHFMQPEEYIPVLISGAAVQLTFGLKHFLIEYFPIINVVKREYSYPGGHKIVEGHVQVDNRSINISWNNFIQDYEDYADSQNVGLHELAHAISFDFLYGFHENKHPHYEEGLKDYIQVAAPVFKELRQGKPHFLDDYGALNVEEFWAVSIETFFEKPVEFREKMPGLYGALCDLLNQDPLKNGKIIDRPLAGLAD